MTTGEQPYAIEGYFFNRRFTWKPASPSRLHTNSEPGSAITFSSSAEATLATRKLSGRNVVLVVFPSLFAALTKKVLRYGAPSRYNHRTLTSVLATVSETTRSVPLSGGPGLSRVRSDGVGGCWVDSQPEKQHVLRMKSTFHH